MKPKRKPSTKLSPRNPPVIPLRRDHAGPMTPRERAAYDRARADGAGAQAAWVEARRDRGGPDVPSDDGESFDLGPYTMTIRVAPDGDGSLTAPFAFTSDAPNGDDIWPRPSPDRREHPCIRVDYGVSDGASFEDIASQVDRAERFASGDWYYVTITVEGEGPFGLEDSASLGGVESDSGDRDTRETVVDLAREAYRALRAAEDSMRAASRGKVRAS